MTITTTDARMASVVVKRYFFNTNLFIIVLTHYRTARTATSHHHAPRKTATRRRAGNEQMSRRAGKTKKVLGCQSITRLPCDGSCDHNAYIYNTRCSLVYFPSVVSILLLDTEGKLFVLSFYYIVILILYLLY
jgi:hypothetical protein